MTLWRIFRIGAGVILLGILFVTMGVGVLLGIVYLLSV